MRIRELFERKEFREEDYIEKKGNKHELAYDLADDLAFFMQENDHAYRKHLYPVVIKVIHATKHNKDVLPSVFSHAVDECYKQYKNEYPIRQLPEEVEQDIKKQVCDKLHEVIKGQIAEGHFEI